MMGMILPAVTLGISSTQFYGLIGVRQNIWTALPLHIVWAVPFGLFILLARFDPNMLLYEEAARTLGASGWRVFREITFPLISNQVIAAGLLGFLLSWSELMRTLFVTGAATTMPLCLFGKITGHPINPHLFAFGTIISIIVLVALVGTALLLTRGGGRRII
jgi:putative spermidine/putrescine transport system permease protein